MLKVNDDKVLKFINDYRSKLGELCEKAKENADKLTDIPDDLREQIRIELLKEYGKPYQDKLDYLMQFVDEEVEPIRSAT